MTSVRPVRVRHLEMRAYYTRRVRTLATFDRLVDAVAFVRAYGRWSRLFIDRRGEPATSARVVAERA